MRRRLGLAVVGAGLASAPHLRSLQELANRVDVRWVIGQKLDRASEMAAQLGAACGTSLDAVCGDPGVEAVLVLTPPNTHGNIVSRLAESGKHVLLEKPLEVSLEASEALVARCRRHGIKLGVVLQHRFRPAVQRLMELMDSGQLGSLTTAAVDVRWWRPQSYYDEPGRGTLARDGGGVLLTQAIHTLDVFLSAVGEPSEIFAFAGTSAVHRMECEDIVAVAMRYPNGAVATLNATTAAGPGFPERIQISGTAGTATLEAGSLQWQSLDGTLTGVEGASRSLGSGADPMDFPHQSHRRLIEDFLESIEQDRDPLASGASALRVHEFIEVILQSAQRRCALPFGPRESGRTIS